MALWSRELLLLVVVAVLASLAPADGFIFDRLSRQSSEVNKPEGGSPATTMSVGCVCDNPPTYACHCGVGIDTTIMGNRVVLEPKVNVEFIPKNVSLVMSVTNQGQTLYKEEISGEKVIPPVCIPVPQLPFIGLCISLNNLSCDLENKSVSFCTVLEVNTMPASLPMHPTLPVGCFSAGLKDGIKYTAPKIKIPGKEDVDKLFPGFPNIPFPSFPEIPSPSFPKIPSPFDNWSIDGIKQAVGWPFGRSALEQADKPEAQMNADVGAGANVQAAVAA